MRHIIVSKLHTVKEVLNPPVHCGESRPTEEPEHLGFVALDFPFGEKKIVDTEPEVR